jgi:hypothetical protein
MHSAADITLITQLVVRERDSRDMGFWNRMLDCFHPDALIDISWIRGNPQQFVDGSKDMAARGMKATHTHVETFVLIVHCSAGFPQS